MGEGKKVLIWKSFLMDPGGALWSDKKLSLDAAPYLAELPEGFKREVHRGRIIYECNGEKYYILRAQTKGPLWLRPESCRRGAVPVQLKVLGRLLWEPKYDEEPFFDGPFGEVIKDDM